MVGAQLSVKVLMNLFSPDAPNETQQTCIKLGMPIMQEELPVIT